MTAPKGKTPLYEIVSTDSGAFRSRILRGARKMTFSKTRTPLWGQFRGNPPDSAPGFEEVLER